MANKKIQITNKSGDNCFPVTKKVCIDDFNHTHTFTGSSTSLSTTGNYDKATSVKVNSFTPTVNVTLTKSKDVGVSTVTIQQITGVGTLPTKENKTVAVNGVKSVTASFTGTKGTISTESVTTETPATYTPEGSISQPSFSGSVNLGSNTTSTSGVKYIEDVSHVAASASGTQSVLKNVTTSSGSFLTGLTTSTTAGGTKYLEDVSVTGGTTSETLSYMHFNAGSVPTRSSFTYVSGVNGGSLEENETAEGGIAYVSQVSGGGASASKGSYTPAGNVSSTFAGTSATITVKGTPSGSIALSGGTLPSLSTTTTSAGNIKYVEAVSHTAASASKETIQQITGVGTLPSLTSNTTSSGGIVYVQNISGGGSTGSDTFVKTINGGSGSLTSSLNNKTLVISHSHNAASVATTGSAITGVSGVSKTLSYLHWNAGALPTRAGVSVVTGVSGGSINATTKYLKFSAGALRTGASFTGNEMTSTGTYKPTGAVNSTFAGTATTALVTSVTSNPVSSSISYLHYTAPTSNTGTAYQITGVGSVPSLTFNETSSGGTQYVHNISSTGASASKTTKYLSGTAGNAVTSVTATDKVSVVSGINGGSISKTIKYFHPSVTGSVTKPSFIGTAARLVHTAKGTVDISTTAADTTTVSSITGVGTLPTRAGVSVVTGISQQPEFTASATVSSITPTATLSHTSTSITLNGTCTPKGTIGNVQ